MSLTPSTEDIVAITQDVWSSFLEEENPTELEIGDPAGPGTEKVTGCVHISGAWEGSILLSCSARAARTVAAALFATTSDEVSSAEVVDAVGELTNMVGGNLKGLLPGPSRLSLPSVTEGIDFQVAIPGSRLIDHVTLRWQGEPVAISVWVV